MNRTFKGEYESDYLCTSLPGWCRSTLLCHGHQHGPDYFVATRALVERMPGIHKGYKGASN